MVLFLSDFLKYSFQSIPPGELAKAEFKLTPPWAGRHQISAKFSSKEMRDVDGFLSLMVLPPDANGLPPENIESRQI